MRLFGAVLLAGLEAGGIVIEGRTPGADKVVRERGRAALAESARRAVEFARLETPIVWSLRAINTDSNNSVADQLFLAFGHHRGGAGTREGAARATREALKRLGVPTTGYEQIDGSGLSRGNRVSAEQLSALLVAVHARPEAWKLYRDSLAVGGESGRLASRFDGPDLRGRVHAKTGWISGTSALSGVVETDGGEELCFSILVEYPDVSSMNTSVWKPMQDELCARIARWGRD